MRRPGYLGDLNDFWGVGTVRNQYSYFSGKEKDKEAEKAAKEYEKMMKERQKAAKEAERARREAAEEAAEERAERMEEAAEAFAKQQKHMPTPVTSLQPKSAPTITKEIAKLQAKGLTNIQQSLPIPSPTDPAETDNTDEPKVTAKLPPIPPPPGIMVPSRAAQIVYRSAPPPPKALPQKGFLSPEAARIGKIAAAIGAGMLFL